MNTLTALLHADLRRLVRSRALGGPNGVLARRPPRLVVRARGRERTTMGWADHDQNEIVVVMHPGMWTADARATLAHEAVHLAGFRRHDAEFRHVLVAVAAEVYDLDVSAHATGRYSALDRALESALWWRGLRGWASEALGTLAVWFATVVMPRRGFYAACAGMSAPRSRRATATRRS